MPGQPISSLSIPELPKKVRLELDFTVELRSSQRFGLGDIRLRRRKVVGNASDRLRKFWLAGIRTAATLLIFGGPASAVPIDLTDATPSITGATTLHIDGISTLGANYWADFKWNDKTNKFDVTAYGEEEDAPEGFALAESGTFLMGSPEDELGRENNGQDETQHQVTLTRDFYIGENEVTQAEWTAVMGSNPSQFAGCDNCPVEWVTWYDVVDYCNARSDQEGLTPAYEVEGTSVSWDQDADGYRLPTEAEWEYACRAGTSTAFYSGGITSTGCDEPNLDPIAWYCGNNGDIGEPNYGTKEVGQMRPNAWGIYGMSGNVEEWVWDRIAPYPAGPVTDPIGPPSGFACVRGGFWHTSALACRSANRYRDTQIRVRNYIGFRVARWTD